MDYIWTYESFGDTVPSNWEDICAAVNHWLLMQQQENSVFDYDLQSMSDRAFEKFCELGYICGITAIYE